MNNAARKQRIIERDPVDVALTIVPTEHDDPQPFVPRSRAVATPALREVPPPAPTPVPAPRRSSGLLVVGAVSGGAVLGGGVVGLASLLALGATVLAAGAAVVVWWIATLAPAAPAVEPVAAAPVAEEVVVEEPVVDVAPEAPAAPTRPAPKASAPAAAAPAPTTPDTAKPAAPAAAPAATELPDDFVSMKFITDPPAVLLFVDGEPKGRTPAKLQLSAGPHTIRLESGKASGSFEVDAGMDPERACYALEGKKIVASACH